jgi:hypothetical protein
MQRTITIWTPLSFTLQLAALARAPHLRESDPEHRVEPSESTRRLHTSLWFSKRKNKEGGN